MPELVLGPVYRYAGETDATVWVETSGPCEVEVLGQRERTFCVERHHYALVVIRGLAPGLTYPYEVRLDRERAWPAPGSAFPASVIRTLAPGTELDVAFGSCRVALPHEPPYTLSPDEDERGLARRELDLEHWAAFQDSFHRMARLLADIAAGRRGEPPATICLLGGDVHHAFPADVAFPRATAARSRVVQAVCSPFRNDLDRRERRVLRFAASRPGRAIGRALAAAAGVEDPGIRWRVTDRPYFDNQVATLRIRGRALEVDIDKTVAGDPDPELERVCRRRLA